MSKPAKSGLGRGLNSLLGGTYNEATFPEKVTPEQRVVVDNNIKHREERVPTDKVAISDSLEKPEAYTSREDHLTIKSVVQRKTDEVALDHIMPNPDQPRTNFKREELEELSASIEKDGLLQPILVRAVSDGRYQIIAGERRWQACRLANLKTVPIRIKEADDDKALELALIENLQRTDLNPIEEAYGYRRIMERQNITQSEVAQMMSKGRSTVANAIRLLELPEQAQQLLFEEKITAGHARAILSIPSKEGRESLTNKLKAEKLSVREAEAIARLLAGRKNSSNAHVRQAIPQSYKTIAKALREALQTKVKVKSVQGKNKIEIEFKDEEELEKLFGDLISTLS